jgi:hypothetical protein
LRLLSVLKIKKTKTKTGFRNQVIKSGFLPYTKSEWGIDKEKDDDKRRGRRGLVEWLK